MTERLYVPGRRLGKAPAVHKPTDLLFAAYATPELSAPPDAVDHSVGVTYGIYLNDRIGDCAIVAPANHVRTWTFRDQGAQQDIPVDDVVAAYSKVSGYDPRTGENDNGCVEADVLSLWRHEGIGGHTIGANVAVNVGKRREVEQGIDLLGGLYIGAQLPKTAADENAKGQIWKPHRGRSGAPGSWGGHAMHAVGYGPLGVLAATWGALQWMTWNFWLEYVDEAHGIVSPDWLGSDNKSPAGFDDAQLTRDLGALKR